MLRKTNDQEFNTTTKCTKEGINRNQKRKKLDHKVLENDKTDTEDNEKEEEATT